MQIQLYKYSKISICFTWLDSQFYSPSKVLKNERLFMALKPRRSTDHRFATPTNTYLRHKVHWFITPPPLLKITGAMAVTPAPLSALVSGIELTALPVYYITFENSYCKYLYMHRLYRKYQGLSKLSFHVNVVCKFRRKKMFR